MNGLYLATFGVSQFSPTQITKVMITSCFSRAGCNRWFGDECFATGAGLSARADRLGYAEIDT
jgi:hypothetical protein